MKIKIMMTDIAELACARRSVSIQQSSTKMEQKETEEKREGGSERNLPSFFPGFISRRSAGSTIASLFTN